MSSACHPWPEPNAPPREQLGADTQTRLWLFWFGVFFLNLGHSGVGLFSWQLAVFADAPTRTSIKKK